MKLTLPGAQIFIPDATSTHEALNRTTHLAIGAHQDDLEIMAIDGILKCFQLHDKWFTGVVVTDGRGPLRNGPYEHFTNEEMHLVRIKEQKKAAMIGEYSAQVFLDYPSSVIKNPIDTRSTDDMTSLLKSTKPEIIYTHNPADKHDTHVAVLLRVLDAIWQLPINQRPKHLYGCEVWRNVDWLLDEDKVVFDTSKHKNLQAALIEVHDSQISGGKSYDLATMGRRLTNSTYHNSLGFESMTGAAFAMNLTPLIHQRGLDIDIFLKEIIERFAIDCQRRLERVR
ncbi:MAG: PIG-L family deacetylase [Anaerolineaceae bacterium]|nr:PIG-L family deacetylase [Anaerolineaceae bacterium]